MLGYYGDLVVKSNQDNSLWAWVNEMPHPLASWLKLLQVHYVSYFFVIKQPQYVHGILLGTTNAITVGLECFY